MMHQQQVIHSG